VLSKSQSTKGWCGLAKKTKKTTKKKAAKKTAKKTTKKTTKKVAKKTTKKTTKKKVAKKPTTKKAPSRTSTTKKKTTKKPAAKKVTKKKPAAKKSAKKTTKKAAAKTTKKTTKKVAKKTTKKAAVTKESNTKADTKPAAASSKDDAAKTTKKPTRPRNKKKSPEDYAPPPRPLLLGPNSLLKGGPLIASTKRPKKSAAKETKVSRRTKTPFTPKQLDEYKLILLQKRAELVGDVQNLEDEALRSNSGETQTASNAAEFGSESFEQGLNLELAAADRNLIHEIDEALARIADRTYGLCVELHIPIKKARLEELPWAKYSIEAARMLDKKYKH
jgi:RNA polymerase-binding transcription factor DksA